MSLEIDQTGETARTSSPVRHGAFPDGQAAERLWCDRPEGIRRMDGRTGGDPDLHYVIFRPAAHPTGTPPGPPVDPLVVLVHGAEHSAWCWEPVATLLAERFGLTVVSMDLRGHGASVGSQPPKFATLADFGEDVARVIDEACLDLASGAAATPADMESAERRAAAGDTASGARRYARAAGGRWEVFLVGHSLGGFVADALARRYPFAGVYILGSVTPMQVLAASLGWIMRSLNPLHLHRTWTCLRAMRGRGLLFGTRGLVRAWLLGPKASPELVDQLFAHLLKERETVVALREVQASGKADRRALRSNTHHLRDVWQTTRRRYAAGACDVLMAPRASAQSARLMGATFAVLPGLPHDAMLASNDSTEQLGEAVAVDIAQFVLPMPRAAVASPTGDATDLSVVRMMEQSLRQRR